MTANNVVTTITLLANFFLQVDELTKKFVKSAEDMCKAKEKEISSG